MSNFVFSMSNITTNNTIHNKQNSTTFDPYIAQRTHLKRQLYSTIKDIITPFSLARLRFMNIFATFVGCSRICAWAESETRIQQTKKT